MHICISLHCKCGSNPGRVI